MALKQISVFLENKQGTLATATKVLAENGVDLIALSIADTEDFGIMRCIVQDPEKAYQLLSNQGFATKLTEVIAVEVPDRPGGLAEVLAALDENDISVEYLYSFVRTPNENALILFRVDDNEKCIAVLKEHAVRFYTDQKDLKAYK